MVKTLHCEGIRQTILTLDQLGAIDQANSLRSVLTQCTEESLDSPENNIGLDLPPLLIRGLNFAGAISRYTKNGFRRRSQQEIEERLAICQACPQFIDNHCRICGCPCIETNQLMNKLALASEACPLGKWK
jgi:hypothetical protein